MKIAVVLHLFYDDLAMEFVKYLRNIPFNFDIYISTTPQAREKIHSLFSHEFKKSNIMVAAVPNYGMDIAPFIIEFKKFYSKYSFICKIHGKKSLHAITLKNWRDYLLNNLLGSKEIVEKILNYFADDKTLGIVFPEKYDKIIRKDLWKESWNNCLMLTQKLGLKLDSKNLPSFPTGSMFWFRPKALQPLFDLGLKYNDFISKSNQIDGTLAHSIERLFVLVAEKQGYKYKKILFKKINSDGKIIDMYIAIKKYFIYKLPYSWQKKIFSIGRKLIRKRERIKNFLP